MFAAPAAFVWAETAAHCAFSISSTTRPFGAQPEHPAHSASTANIGRTFFIASTYHGLARGRKPYSTPATAASRAATRAPSAACPPPCDLAFLMARTRSSHFAIAAARLDSTRAQFTGLAWNS